MLLKFQGFTKEKFNACLQFPNKNWKDFVNEEAEHWLKQGAGDLRTEGLKICFPKGEETPVNVCVLFDKEEPIANICMQSYKTLGEQKKINYLFMLYVKEQYRKQKIGTKLLHFMVSLCNRLDVNEVGSRVDEDNIASIKLFEKCGFKREEPTIKVRNMGKPQIGFVYKEDKE